MKIIIEKISEEQFIEQGVDKWPIWEKEVPTFDWYYGKLEKCYFLEGKVVVQADDGEVEIKKGDFVTFPIGLKCIWKVLEPVRKHYKFE